MMTKPKAIQWLEDQTGESIDYVPDEAPSSDRHLSVRVNGELAAGLHVLAQERDISVSQLVREIVSEAVAQRQAVASLDARALSERLAADVAEVRRRLAG